MKTKKRASKKGKKLAGKRLGSAKTLRGAQPKAVNAYLYIG